MDIIFLIHVSRLTLAIAIASNPLPPPISSILYFRLGLFVKVGSFDKIAAIRSNMYKSWGCFFHCHLLPDLPSNRVTFSWSELELPAALSGMYSTIGNFSRYF